jgi:hypothetical protein
MLATQEHGFSWYSVNLKWPSGLLPCRVSAAAAFGSRLALGDNESRALRHSEQLKARKFRNMYLGSYLSITYHTYQNT